MQKSSLRGKVVLVFGGGRGIGQSIALACAEAGARVGVASRTQSELEATYQLILEKTDQKIFFAPCDVAQPQSVSQFVQKATQSLGPVSGMVIAAGIYGAIGPIDETKPEDWRKAIEVNVMGSFNCLHAVAGEMKRRKSGNIVLFSGGGQNGIANFSSYTASKGALWRLTESAGLELAPFGVYVNAVAPGLVNTRFLDDLLAAGPDKVGTELYDRSKKQKESGGIPPEQAADCVLWLLSGDSGTLAGKTVSARWDDYRGIRDTQKYNQSEIFTFKRVMDFEGNTVPPEKRKL